MSFTITAPDARVDGVHSFGPTTLHFQKGVASTDEVGEGLSAYLHSAGYTVEETAGDPVQYDPAKDSVEKVLAYLATATPEERERVLTEESNGKARKGVLEGAQDAPEEDAADDAGDVL